MGETTRKCRCVLFKIGQSKELRRKYDIRQSDLRWAGGPIMRYFLSFSKTQNFGSGTTLIAADDVTRNAVGFDLKKEYIQLCGERIAPQNLFDATHLLAIHDDARNIDQYLSENSLSLIFTSPPYANLLNRKRKKQI